MFVDGNSSLLIKKENSKNQQHPLYKFNFQQSEFIKTVLNNKSTKKQKFSRIDFFRCLFRITNFALARALPEKPE